MPNLNFPRVCGQPKVQAKYNVLPEHFQVFEIPSVSAEGHGDHFFVKIRKRDSNTHAVVQSFCRQLGLKPVDIGYAGRKDKWAITEQW
ncbi:MAG: tRNA pseudouridine(13) synthase TruD, partial [Enterobacterales bacterium]|nr:tRNA pseudouridine(13) synthase TruD [Enterobacterales bacterium]